MRPSRPPLDPPMACYTKAIVSLIESRLQFRISVFACVCVLGGGGGDGGGSPQIFEVPNVPLRA